MELGAWQDRADAWLREYFGKYLEAQNRPGAVGKWMQKHEKTAAVVGAVGEGFAYVGDAGTTAFNHAAGGLSVVVGKSAQAQAAVQRSGAQLLRYFGMDTAAGWADTASRESEAMGGEYTTYGVSTMMQSRWAARDGPWRSDGSSASEGSSSRGTKARQCSSVTHITATQPSAQG